MHFSVKFFHFVERAEAQAASMQHLSVKICSVLVSCTGHKIELMSTLLSD